MMQCSCNYSPELKLIESQVFKSQAPAEAEASVGRFDSKLDNMKSKLDHIYYRLDHMDFSFTIELLTIKEFLDVLSRVSRYTNYDEEHKEGGGEDRGTNEDPDVGVIDHVVILDLDAVRNDIEADQQEELVGAMVDASEVSIEDAWIFVVPMDYSDVEDGVPPFPILSSNELQFKELCFNIQSLTFSTMSEPSLDKEEDNEAYPPQLKRKKLVKFPPLMQRNRRNRDLMEDGKKAMDGPDYICPIMDQSDLRYFFDYALGVIKDCRLLFEVYWLMGLVNMKQHWLIVAADIKHCNDWSSQHKITFQEPLLASEKDQGNSTKWGIGSDRDGLGSIGNKEVVDDGGHESDIEFGVDDDVWSSYV
ncbi:hypothetical protein E5676_scaffold236G00110 [Cucumis melo var. makuwa]|uniref:Ulp1-like peptidase n=1 Tax=Cucumis melo var. makuwa TaxID=1194695 RepID=A0A5D3DTY6_CUCMM|nr:hypothetical protein E6C27_scaffold61G002170 [Cucumis melo var. makuwa]TYK27166.1 hypothetical protein E5676_scaffold236G00110 [Cucumis melo var. makuwa]